MLKNNTVLKILSLLSAIVLWVYVMGEVNPTITRTIENIPVELLNENTLQQRELAIKNQAGFTADVIVEGKRADINSLDREKIKATADIFGYEEGDNYVPVQLEMPDNIKLREIKTPKIQVTLEKLTSVYKAVTVEFTGEKEEGTQPGNVEVSPAEVEVKGGESAVNSVERVEAKVPSEEIGNELEVVTAEPVAVDKKGKQVFNVTLSADTIEVKAILYHTKTVPLKVKITGTVPAAYQVDEISVPDEISIRGPKDTLDTIQSVTAEPIDLSHVTASTTLPLKPKLPKHVEVADESQNQGAEIKIKGLSTKKIGIRAKNIELKNLPENMDAYVNTDRITVVVTGKEEDLEDLSREDFHVSIDLQNKKEGTHAVKAAVTTEKTVNSMKLKPAKVEVTIKEQR